MKFDRRQALALIGLGAAAPAATQATTRPGGSFKHGVASGDPLADRVVLWTKVTTDGEAQPEVAWEVAEDAGFRRIVRRGTTRAALRRDYTVKVDVTGLRHGREYHYRFRSGEWTSPVGRTKTLPRGRTADVVLAVASCSLHPGGWFNAYDAIAKLPRVDAVVHLGDYIYEYGAADTDYGLQIGRALNRVPDPPHEIKTLADYRTRHAQYKSDPDLQAAHARAPWIVVWDDHEIANDAWLQGAENHDPAEGEGDWRARKAAALQAYYEWMPIREPEPGRAREAVQRSFQFGDVATLLMVETRLQGRAEQVPYEAFADLPTTPGPDGRPVRDRRALTRRLNANNRDLLGAAQRAWLDRELRASRRAGTSWQVLGNQVVMARVDGPDLNRALGAERAAALLAGLPEAIRPRVQRIAALYSSPLPFNMDAWDGYPAARERLYDLLKATGARPIVLSGDSHATWVNQLHDDAGRRVGAEFGVTAVTSPSWGDAMGGFDLGAVTAAQNDEVLFNDVNAKGFAVLTLTRDSAVGEPIAVSTVRAKPYATRSLGRWRAALTPDGMGELQRL